MSDAAAVHEQLQQLVRAFTQRFDRPPTVAAAAPGRVNLIGEHTDYNDGFVMPMAIERQAVIVAAPADGSVCTVVSTGDRHDATFKPDAALQPGEPVWANYVKGVVRFAQEAGIDAGAFDAMIDSTVPIGGGLSSSAAFEVATATLLEGLSGKTLPPVDKALMAQRAEHEFAGVPCGIMDQFISVMGKAGHAMLLDCRRHEPRMVRMADPSVAVLIANSNVKHELSGGEYAERRAQCEAAAEVLGVTALRDATHESLYRGKGQMDATVFKRAHHVIGENERTLRAANLLEAGDWAGVGRLMFDSHASLRDRFEVSCEELDVLVDIAGSLVGSGGVYGSRMTGGGFGGCTVSLVRTDKAANIGRVLHTEYLKRTEIEPMIFVSQPAAGARLLQLKACD